MVQLYVSHPDSKVTRPIKELKGFARVALMPGETRTVRFTLAAGQLAWWNGTGWAVEPEIVHVLVGSSSEDIRLRGEVRVKSGQKRSGLPKWPLRILRLRRGPTPTPLRMSR